MWHLLTHTRGLTYGFHYAHPLDGIYRDHGFEFGAPHGHGPGRVPRRVGARCRCCSSPAPSSTTASPPTCSAGWSRCISGQPLDAFLKERDPRPAGHARHRVRRADPHRLAALYDARPGAQRPAWARPRCTRRRSSPAAAGWSRTAADYHRFTSMLLGGASSTARACSGRVRCATWAATTCPAAPSSRPSRGRRSPRPRTTGMGFGLGFSVVLDAGGDEGRLPRRASSPGAALASTAFWVDPKERITRAVLHPAGAVEHLPAALAAAPARLPGAGGLMRAKLVGVPGSHPCVSAELMLRYKGIEFTRLDLPNMTHKAILPLMRYRGSTVPVMNDRRQAGVGDDEDRPRAGGARARAAAVPARTARRSRAPRRGRTPCSRTACASSRARRSARTRSRWRASSPAR